MQDNIDAIEDILNSLQGNEDANKELVDQPVAYPQGQLDGDREGLASWDNPVEKKNA